jgi:hypothetical protein
MKKIKYSTMISSEDEEKTVEDCKKMKRFNLDLNC